MEFLDRQVNHNLFGAGRICCKDIRHLTVAFPEHGEKQFIYPDAFEKFLSVSDPDLAQRVSTDLQCRLAELEAERVNRQLEKENGLRRDQAEYQRLLNAKGSRGSRTTKTAGTSKTAAAKAEAEAAGSTAATASKTKTAAGKTRTAASRTKTAAGKTKSAGVTTSGDDNIMAVLEPMAATQE